MNSLSSSFGLPRKKCLMWGVEITPCTKSELLEIANRLAAKAEKNLVLGHNLHSTYLYHRDSVFSQAYDAASIVLCDGAPIKLDASLSQILLGNRSKIQRIGSTDWLPSFLAEIQGLRVAVIGAKPEVNQKFLKSQLSQFPKTHKLGFPGTDWDSNSENEMVRQLQDFEPNIVLFGMGMPLQEHLIVRNFGNLPNSLYVLVGGAIDQLVGEQLLAPRWLGPLGLEWLWRLASQPKRLWERYLLEPWKLVVIRIRQLLKK